MEPQAVRVSGRTEPCPNCGTTAWFGPRAFKGQAISYHLCKWCGYRRTASDKPEDGTLAVPVYHRCSPDTVLLTWHQFEGEPYRHKTWNCECGAVLRVMETLRPFPRF